MTLYRNTTIDGRRIFYREAGPTDAPAIVLLHGFPSSSHMFRDLIPQLADCFHVIAPDYIGFGYSDAPSASEFGYTFDNITTPVESLLFDVREFWVSSGSKDLRADGAACGIRGGTRATGLRQQGI